MINIQIFIKVNFKNEESLKCGQYDIDLMIN